MPSTGHPPRSSLPAISESPQIVRQSHIILSTDCTGSRLRRWSGICVRSGRVSIDFNTDRQNVRTVRRPGESGFDYTDPVRSFLLTCPINPRNARSCCASGFCRRRCRGVYLQRGRTPDKHRCLPPARNASRRPQPCRSGSYVLFAVLTLVLFSSG